MSLYRRDNSPYWWSRLIIGGHAYQFSTRERNKTEGLRAEREKAEEIKNYVFGKGGIKLCDLVGDFVEWKQINGMSSEWSETVERHLGSTILPFFGRNTDISLIDEQLLSQFRTARLKEVQPQTVCKELTTLRQLLKYTFYERKAIKKLPHVRNPKCSYEPKWTLLKPEQVIALLDELAKSKSKEALPHFLIMANTGMRGGEVTKLTWEMVDRQANVLRLPGAITKNRKARVIDINPGCDAALKLMHRDIAKGKIFEQSCHKTAWYKARTAVELGKVRPHDLRHFFGTGLHGSGASLPTIRDVMGHLTLCMANLYAHSYDEQRKKAVVAVSTVPSVDTPPKGQPGADRNVDENVVFRGPTVDENDLKRPLTKSGRKNVS